LALALRLLNVLPQMPKILAWTTLAATAALAGGGCSMFMRSIEKPSAEVRTVSMSTVSWSGVEGGLSLDVSNPNGFGVPLSGIDWELAVGGARAVTGKVELQQEIPARGVAPVQTSLRVDVRDAAVVASALSAGRRDYALRARLHFSTSFGPLAVDLEHRGELGGAGATAGARSILGGL
jgi:LEA14-like dessication related protein